MASFIGPLAVGLGPSAQGLGMLGRGLGPQLEWVRLAMLWAGVGVKDTGRGPESASLWYADGQKLVSSSGDKTIRIWDWYKRQILFTFEGHSAVVWSSVFNFLDDKVPECAALCCVMPPLLVELSALLQVVSHASPRSLINPQYAHEKGRGSTGPRNNNQTECHTGGQRAHLKLLVCGVGVCVCGVGDRGWGVGIGAHLTAPNVFHTVACATLTTVDLPQVVSASMDGTLKVWRKDETGTCIKV